MPDFDEEIRRLDEAARQLEAQQARRANGPLDPAEMDADTYAAYAEAQRQRLEREEVEPDEPPPRWHSFLPRPWCELELQERDWLLKDLLCTTSRWLVVGKTLLLLDLAHAIGKGRSLEGER